MKTNEQIDWLLKGMLFMACITAITGNAWVYLVGFDTHLLLLWDVGVMLGVALMYLAFDTLRED